MALTMLATCNSTGVTVIRALPDITKGPNGIGTDDIALTRPVL